MGALPKYMVDTFIFGGNDSSMAHKPCIVIIGAGYGGIVTALRLQKELMDNEAEVILVNKHDYHYITTHLHMPAAGTDDVQNARVNITSLIDTQKIRFLKAQVTKIVPEKKRVELEDGHLAYDYAVVALGGEPETFGIPGLKEHAFFIRSINSVQLIREHIEYQFARYKQEPHRHDYVTFVVGGAGFTGIEFLGELADRIPKLCASFGVDAQHVRVINVEASGSALPGFDPGLVEYGMDVLRRKGVTFRFGVPVKQCNADHIVLANDEVIPCSTVIWTGGVRGNRLVEDMGFDSIRARVKVDEFLRVPAYPEMTVIGDSSIVFSEDGKPLPPTAQLAIAQADALAVNLVAQLRGQPLRTFQYKSKGTVASLGKGEAIGIVAKYKVKGSVAAVLKKVIDLRYLYIIGGIPLVLRKGNFS